MPVSVPTKIAEYNTSGSNVTTTGAVALTSAVASGSVIVLGVVGGNAGRTFTPSSSAGLTWVRAVTPWPETTASTTATLGVWYAVVTAGLTTSDTITVTQDTSTLLGMVAYAYTGVDTTAPIASYSSGANSTTVATLTLSPIAAVSSGAVIAFFGGGGVMGLPASSSVPSTRILAANPTGGSSNRLLHVAVDNSGTAGSVTPSLTLASGMRQAGIALALNPTESVPTPGSVYWVWTGSPTDSTVEVHAKTTGASSCRLAISTNSGMSSPAYVAAQTPDSYGIVRFHATGLSANTRYYFQVTDTPTGGSETLIGTVGTIRTLQTAGVPFSGTRKVIIGGCLRTNATVNTGLDSAIAWGADWAHFNGDFFYNANNETNEATWVGKYNSQIAGVSSLPNFLASGLAAYESVSDHDSTNVDNGDSNTAWAPYELSAWRKVVPHLPGSGDSTTRDQQWDDGRVSYFMIDIRHVNRSPGSNTDNSSKTMLGSAQKARLFDWLENNPAPFKVIISDSPWMGAPDVVAKKDAWWSYATERQEIIDAIDAQNAHVELWHGDGHGIGYATPAKNTWGNFPILWGAAYYMDGGAFNLPTFSEYYTNSGNWLSVYGRVSFTDDGTSITRTFSGWDADNNIERMSYVTTVNTSETRTATGDITLTGSATAIASGGVATRTAQGTITLSGTADGQAAGGTPVRTATGTITLTGTATALAYAPGASSAYLGDLTVTLKIGDYPVTLG